MQNNSSKLFVLTYFSFVLVICFWELKATPKQMLGSDIDYFGLPICPQETQSAT